MKNLTSILFIVIFILFGGCNYKSSISLNRLISQSKPLKWPEYRIKNFIIENHIKFLLIRDTRLPLIHMNILIKAGKIQEKAGKEGLFDVLREALITGGSKRYPKEKFASIFEEHGADFDIFFTTVNGYISLTCLKEDFSLLASAIINLLKEPLFPEEEINLAKKLVKNRIYRRNDSPIEIAIREFKKLIYGKDSPYSRFPSCKSIDSITKNDLLEVAERIFTGKNLIVGIEGNFDQGIINDLKNEFSELPSGSKNKMYFPKPTSLHKNLVFFVDKPDLNQATIIMGHLGGYRLDPYYPAIQIYNMILSGGFSGRLFKEIRTKKGLVYSIFGRYDCKYFYPGLFYVIFQTANSNVKNAILEVKNILSNLKHSITPNDVKEAKNMFLNSLVFRFDHPIKVLKRKLYYEYTNMPQDSFKKLIEKIKGLSLDDVKKVAKDYIHPDRIVILVVGDKKSLSEQLKELNVKEIEAN